MSISMSGRNGSGERTSADGGDAVELFARRAAVAVPGFAVTDANRADVVRLCRRLDGVPLTIELRGRPAHAVLARGDQPAPRQQARAAHRRAATPSERHATARNAIAWSYDTCTTTERTLWARLSVFPASFDAAAAAEVCASGELSGTEIFETILRLVDKSLVMQAGADGRRAATLPDARHHSRVRRGAAARRPAKTAASATASSPATWRMARHVEEHVFGDEQLELFCELRREQASIRAALEYSLGGRIRQPDRERDGAELATRLWAYWVSCGRMVEADYWLSKALELIPDPCPQRAWVLAVRCFLGAVRGAIPQAVADGRAAVGSRNRCGGR